VEGPIEFDVLGYVEPNKQVEVCKLLEKNSDKSRFSVRKEVLSSVKENKLVSIAVGLGWNEVQSLVQNTPIGFISLKIVESTYWVSKEMSYCDSHSLYFSSSKNCPVCTKWYVNTNSDKQKVKVL